MTAPFRFDVLTLFPEIFDGFLGQSILKRSSDHEEGARAFVEKRKPQFTGR